MDSTDCCGLVTSSEFTDDLDLIAKYLAQEQSRGLEIGRLAAKWVGSHRYDRYLNADTFADELHRHTGTEVTGRAIRQYISAHRMQRLIDQSGKRFPHLTVSHLIGIAQAHCETDEERLELAQQSNDCRATVRQIREIACKLHLKRIRTERRGSIHRAKPLVSVMDGLDLIREQVDSSIDCLVLDWQWSQPRCRQINDLPAPHCHHDPVTHLCDCLAAAGAKLSPEGLVYVFHTSVGLLDRAIEDAWVAAGLKHAGELIWQKAAGGLMDMGTPLAVAHEPIHILCRQGVNPKSMRGYTSSVTPPWAAPTNANSGRQRLACHPHQKPVELMEWLIGVATVNGLVVDCFAGSGSCGVAAVRCGCSYVGAEFVPEYAEIANERIATEPRDPPVEEPPPPLALDAEDDEADLVCGSIEPGVANGSMGESQQELEMAGAL